MTNIILIHAQGADAHSNWYEWLQACLKLEGYHMDIVNIKHGLPVDMNQWMKQLETQIDITTYDTYFVTHGFGTLAGLYYLNNHPDMHIEGFFSIAGFGPDAEDVNTSITVPDIQLDYDSLKQRVDYFYGLCSKDDSIVPYQNTVRLLEKLGGKCRIINDGGHFRTEDGYDTFLRLKNNMMKKMSR